tara:strand:- start:990 stop:2399 length:1410 start_codon:yes stop_codon:yes gene_type:complete
MGQAKLNYTKTNKYLYPAYQDFVVHAHSGDTTGSTYIHPYGFVTISNFKYTLEIKINGTSVVKLKAPMDNNDNANFHIQKVFQDYLKTDITPYHTDTDANKLPIHKVQGFNRNQNTLVEVEVLVGQEYNYASQSGSVTGLFFSNQTPLASNTQSTGVDTTFFVFNGVAQHETGEVFEVNTYELDGDGKFLTEYNTTNNQVTLQKETFSNRLRRTDYHTVGLFYGDKETFTSDAYDMRILLYDVDFNGIASATVSNPFATSTIVQDGMTHEKGIQWFGAGAQNLIDAGTFTEANFAASTFYSISTRDSSGSGTLEFSRWFYLVDDDCKGFETIRLAYVNTLGAWDYYNFNKRSTKSSTSKRTTFEANYGFNQDAGTDGWDYLTNQGGTQVLSNTVNEEIEANTDFIGEDMAVILKSLFVSPNVQMQLADGTWVGVVVVEKEYVKQTKANDNVIQYVIGISKSQKYKVQRR